MIATAMRAARMTGMAFCIKFSAGRKSNNAISDAQWVIVDRKLGWHHPSRGKLLQWEVGKGAIGIRWTHEHAGVLTHIPESLATELLGRIEIHAYG
jgi:hypothetical protein